MQEQGLSAAAATLARYFAGHHSSQSAQATSGERLQALREAISGRLVFTTSFGLEDQIITHFLAGAGIEADIVTLDTGRLFPETYTLWQETEARYGIRIRPFHADRDALEALVAAQGINGFYRSIDARHACCQVRKIAPLDRALAGASAWITGLRGDASTNRAAMQPVEFDEARGLVKFSPLFDWSREGAVQFAADADVPVNPLHRQGFVSIGCAPCTRAISPGEPERAGRWWWEQEDARECGLHVDESGRLVRTAEANAEQGA